MSRRPIDRTQLSAVLLSTLLAVSIVGAVALAPAVAEHPEDAPDYTGEAFFEISEVSADDHHPGQDEGSMQYFSGGSEAFNDQDAEEGVWIDYIIVDSFYDGEQWIDYSDCSTENTAAFGIDRGGDNEGTNYDEDLVQKQKQSDFRDDGITVEFYNHEDLGGDPPYMAPEDHIVAEQGENSAGGGCLGITEEPGWYRMQGFLNGTVADNGDSEPPSDNADQVEVSVQSTWFYVCDCDSREEAEEELGPPPEDDSEAQAEDGAGADDSDSSDEGGEDTPSDEGGEDTPSDEGGEETPTDDGGDDGASGDEGTPTDDGAGSDETGDDGAGSDETGDDGAGSDETGDDGAGSDETGDDDGAGTNDSTGDDGAGTNDSAGNESGQGDGDTFGNDSEGTPTADDGPGFGAIAALLALLGSALLLNRRR